MDLGPGPIFAEYHFIYSYSICWSSEFSIDDFHDIALRPLILDQAAQASSNPVRGIYKKSYVLSHIL